MLRLALKTGSYSLMHFTVAIAVTFAITGSWKAALAVGIVEPLVQTFAFLLHDRIWSRLDRRAAQGHALPPGRPLLQPPTA